MARVTATASIEIAAPATEVFAYLSDVRRHGEWSPKPYRVEGLAAGSPITRGTRFTSYGWLPNDKDHRNEVEVAELDAPTRLVLEASDGGEQFVTTFTVTQNGTGTRVQRVMDMPKPGGFVGLVFPVILSRVINPDLNKGLRKLKVKLEHGDG
jgi:uncharacterized protein YndB with AHSA1/START domain